MANQQHDLVILGGGPAGYVAAIRASQLGLNAACVEQENLLGGTCLRVGCIPSKSLLESTHRLVELQHGLAEHGIRVADVQFDLATMMKRKERVVQTLSRGIDGLLQKNKVTRYLGRARLDGPQRVTVTGGQSALLLQAPRILIATGSQPARLPGIEPDGTWITTSTEALSYREIPRKLVVIGGGYIGLELGSVWLRLGAEVVVLEALPRILPGMDSEIAAAAQRLFARQGLQFELGVQIEQVEAVNGQVIIRRRESEPLTCDRVLVAVGRVASTENLGLETVGVQVEARGEIPVNDEWQTSAAGVYAVGDCIRGPKLAHKASHEALACVERMVTGHSHINYEAIPGVVYTAPEIASVGKTEDQLQAAGTAYRKGTFPFAASGRARTLGETDGLVKVLADQDTDRLLGVHALGPRAGDLIAEATAAMQFGASSEDLATVCHAHPTLSEALGEAALAADRRAIHLFTPRQ